MSTVNRLRYWMALILSIAAVGFMMKNQVLVGVYCLITAVLTLPILYQLLLIKSNEVQLLSPLVFLMVTVFSFYILETIPPATPAPLKTEIIVGTTVATTATTGVETSSSETTQTTPLSSGSVYRTPSGKRYHYDKACGGENSYEVTLDDAIADELTPCKKCAGG